MWHTNTLNLPHCWLLRVTEKNLKKSTEMKCGKGKRAKCEAPQSITVGNSSLAPRGRGWWDVHCTFPRCQHFHWGASTAAGPQLKNLAKISIFTAHFRIFSAEDALTLKRSQVFTYGWNIQAVFCAVTTLGSHAFIYKHCSSMHSRVQSFNWDNLSTGHEQFKRGSVTSSEVRVHTWRAALHQLMSAGLPWSPGTWAGTDSSSIWNTGKEFWDTEQGRQTSKKGM